MNIEVWEKRQENIKKVHKLRKEKTHDLVNKALNELKRKNFSINFNSVSKQSGVSKSTLYGVSEYKEAIMKARDEYDVIKPKKESVNEASYKAIINSLKNKISRLETENRELKLYIKNYQK